MPTPFKPQTLDEVMRTRTAVAQCGRLLYERRLTDGAGGNISVRLGRLGAWGELEGGERHPRDHGPRGGAWCMSPRFAAHRWHWRLRPHQVLVLDAAGDVVSGQGLPSRDVAVHHAIYRAVPRAGAIIHAHAPWSQVFAAAGAPIPVRLQAAAVLAEVPVVPGEDEPGELARCFAAVAPRVEAFAAAALVHGHGLVVAARDLAHALDAVERCESNARSALFAAQIPPVEGPGPMNGRPQEAVFTP